MNKYFGILIVLLTLSGVKVAPQVVSAGFNQGATGGIAYVTSSWVRGLTGSSDTTTVSLTCAGGETVIMFGLNTQHTSSALNVTVSSGTSQTITKNSDFYNDTINTSGSYQSFYISSCAATSTTVLTLTSTGSGGFGTSVLTIARYTGLTSKALDAAATWLGNTSSTTLTCNNVTSGASGHLVVAFGWPTDNSRTYTSLPSGFTQRQGVGNSITMYADNLSSASGSLSFSATLSSGAANVCTQDVYK